MPSPAARPYGIRPLALAALAALAATALLVLPGGARAVGAANPVTPGTFTGKGFDQCTAPSQYSMNQWRRHSPYRAVGIYLSGNSRACREQANLSATWVRKQLANGWHLLPITLGPQAHCNPRYPRYGSSIDPTIYRKRADTYAKARAQARAEADKTVRAAKRLGIIPGSTMFYDLEGFDQTNSRCAWSSLWFLSAWTNRLHARGYLSGVYSSAGSGIKILDYVRRHRPAGYVLPDQIWLARWDGSANTSAPAYVSDAGWAGHRRVKQYLGGHNETWGGVRINIDRDYLDLRARAVPKPVAGPPTGSKPEPSPSPTPTATPSPKPRSSLADAKCTRDSISRAAYRRVSPHRRHGLVVPLQCLLKQQRLYSGAVSGHWNARTTRALHSYQRSIHRHLHTYVTRPVWVSLITDGAGNHVLAHTGHNNNADVIRVQRALNAAGGARLRVTSHYNSATRRAVVRYQRKVLGRSTGVVATLTWRALHRGRR